MTLVFCYAVLFRQAVQGYNFECVSLLAPFCLFVCLFYLFVCLFVCFTFSSVTVFYFKLISLNNFSFFLSFFINVFIYLFIINSFFHSFFLSSSYLIFICNQYHSHPTPEEEKKTSSIFSIVTAATINLRSSL